MNKDFGSLSIAFILIILGMVVIPIMIGAVMADDATCSKAILIPCWPNRMTLVTWIFYRWKGLSC